MNSITPVIGSLLIPDGGSWKRKTGQKAGLERFQSIQRNAVELDVAPETDGRLLAGRARFCRGWNLLDFLMYPIGYLYKNQLIMAFSGIEAGLAEDPVRVTHTRFKCKALYESHLNSVKAAGTPIYRRVLAF